MPGVWLIGLAFPAALLAGVVVSFVQRHPQRHAIAVGAVGAALFWLIGWSIAKTVGNASRTLEVLFLQLALCTIACFVFAVIAMIAARTLRR